MAKHPLLTSHRSWLLGTLWRHRNPLFVLATSFAVYSLHVVGLRPGYFSRDVYDLTSAFTTADDFCGILTLAVGRAGGPTSLFYNMYIVPFFLANRDLFLLGLFQAGLVSSINAYAWHIVRQHMGQKAATIFVVAVVLYPLMGPLAAFYHRSSLFAFLVYLNFVVLYRLCTTSRLSRIETGLFLTNLLLIAFLRHDGAVVFLVSLSVFVALRAFSRRAFHQAMASCVVLLAYAVFPLFVEIMQPRPSVRHWYPAVRRIHQAVGDDFTTAEMSRLDKVVYLSQDRFDRDAWLAGENYLDNAIFREDLSSKDAEDFKKWSRRYVLRHAPTFLLTQAETFYHSSHLGKTSTCYFINNTPQRGSPYYERYIRFSESSGTLNRMIEDSIIMFWQDFAHQPWSTNLGCFAVSLAYGSFLQVCALLLFTFYSLRQERALPGPILPLLLYGATVFIMQPQPKAYYWSWLVCCGPFLLVVLWQKVVTGGHSSRKLEPALPRHSSGR